MGENGVFDGREHGLWGLMKDLANI
jgi:hypothetical protein